MKYMLTFLLLGLLLSCKNKQEEPQRVDKKESIKTNTPSDATNTGTMPSDYKSIMCFGNSLTAGYGLDEEQAWPYLMQLRIDSLQLPYKVINAGLSGETTSGGLNRIDWILKQKFDYFIIELGANDMLRGLDPSLVRENLEKILDKVKGKYPKVKFIIAGMLASPNMGKEYQEPFNSIYPHLTKKYDAALIPFFLNGVAADPSLNLPDGKHPNAKGQKIVLDNVWKAIAPLIES